MHKQSSFFSSLAHLLTTPTSHRSAHVFVGIDGICKHMQVLMTRSVVHCCVWMWMSNCTQVRFRMPFFKMYACTQSLVLHSHHLSLRADCEHLCTKHRLFFDFSCEQHACSTNTAGICSSLLPSNFVRNFQSSDIFDLSCFVLGLQRLPLLQFTAVCVAFFLVFLRRCFVLVSDSDALV